MKSLQKPASAPRQVVINLLEAVIDKTQPLQDALVNSNQWNNLEPRDRRFSRRLIATYLRRRGDAAHVLARYLSKPLHSRDKKAEVILLLAVVELVWAGSDSHAGVDQAVRLMRGAGYPHLTGLANAVLRKIALDAEAIKLEPETPLRNAPKWLIRALKDDWGDDAEGIMGHLLNPPPLDIRPKNAAEQWAETLDGTALPHGTVRLNDGMVTALAGYDDGEWWVQDAAASLPAMLIASAFDGGIKDKIVVDLCSAPGGKTAQLCANGANVIAIDASSERLKTLNINMKRLNYTPEVITADGMTWSPKTPVDAVLLDAPCSATGTIRRRPDILSHDTPPNLAQLNALQRGLFAAASRWLKPGGVIIFATCSILKAEGEAVVTPIPEGLKEMPITDDELMGFSRYKTAHHKTEDIGVRIMPNALNLDHLANIPQGNDGFFLARFIKS